MSYDYSGLAATAKRMIENFGRSATLRTTTKTGKSYAPTARTATDTAIVMVETSYSRREMDSSGVQIGDKKMLVAASGLTVDPDITYQLIDGAKTWKVIDVKPLQPGDTVLLYEIQARL